MATEALQKKLKVLKELKARLEGITHAGEDRLSFGDVITRPRDAKDLINASLLEEGTDNARAEAFKRAIGSPISMADTMMGLIVDYPAALKARAHENRTHTWNLHAPAGAGKSFNAGAVGSSLLLMHIDTMNKLDEGKKREDIVKGLAKDAEYLFSPYHESSQLKVDWNKWADKFVDSVIEYSKSPDASKLKSLSKVLSSGATYKDLHSLLSVQTVALKGGRGGSSEAETMRVQPSTPIAVFDDLFSSAPRKDQGTFTGLLHSLGDRGSSLGMAIFTNNLDSAYFQKFINDSLGGGNTIQGLYARSGVALKVGAIDEKALSKSREIMHDGLQERLQKQLLKYVYQGHIKKDSNAERILNNLVNSAPDPTRANNALVNMKTSLKKFIEANGEDSIEKALQLHDIADEQGGLRTLKTLRDAAGVDNSLAGLLYAQTKGEPNERMNHVKNLFDTLHNMTEHIGYPFNKKQLKFENEKKADKVFKDLTSKLGDKDELIKALDELTANQAKEETKAEKKKLGKIIWDKVKKAFEDININDFFEHLVDQIQWQSKTPKGEEDYKNYSLVEALNSSHVCRKVKGVDLKNAREEDHIILSKSGDSVIAINKGDLLKDRPIKQLSEFAEAVLDVAKNPEDAKSYLRDILFSSYSPIAAHALASGLGLYETGGASIKGIRGHLEELSKKLSYKEEYDDNDRKLAAETLYNMSKEHDALALKSVDGMHKEFKNILDELIDPKSLKLNEQAVHQLRGVELLTDILSKTKNLNKDILSHLGEDLPEEDIMKLQGFASNFKKLSEETFAPNKPEDEEEFKKQLEEYKKKEVCPDEIREAVADKAYSTVPHTNKVSNFTLSLANTRLMRMLGIE